LQESCNCLYRLHYPFLGCFRKHQRASKWSRSRPRAVNCGGDGLRCVSGGHGHRIESQSAGLETADQTDTLLLCLVRIALRIVKFVAVTKDPIRKSPIFALKTEAFVIRRGARDDRTVPGFLSGKRLRPDFLPPLEPFQRGLIRMTQKGRPYASRGLLYQRPFARHHRSDAINHRNDCDLATIREDSQHQIAERSGAHPWRARGTVLLTKGGGLGPFGVAPRLPGRRRPAMPFACESAVRQELISAPDQLPNLFPPRGPWGCHRRWHVPPILRHSAA